MAAMKRQRCIRRSTIDVLTALGFVAALATGIDVFGQIGGAPVGPIPPGEYPSEPRYLKPGLWEMHLTGAWVDRRFVASAQLEMLANMPAGQRTGLEALVKRDAVQVCFTPAMTSGGMPPRHFDAACEMRGGRSDDNHAYYVINCRSKDGGSTRTQFWTDRPGAGDLITITAIDTSHEAGGATHVIRVDSKLHYLRRDCGNVRPITPAK